MKLSPIVQELRDRCPVFNSNVYGVAEFAAIEDAGPAVVPAAYVLPEEDDVRALRLDHVFELDVFEMFVVVVAIGIDDARGQSAYDQVDDFRSTLLRSLFGWAPDNQGGQIFYEGGELIKMDRARLFYQFTFGRESVMRANEDGRPIDGLTDFGGAKLRLDAINPAADPNVKSPGPDGRIEIGADVSLPQD